MNQIYLSEQKTWEVDWDKVQTVDDLKLIFQATGLKFHGQHWIKGIEHLVREVTK